MKLSKLIPHMEIAYGHEVPKWYGIAYHDFLRGYAVCYPMPLHWIVRIADRIWWRFKHPLPSDFEAELAKARNDGYQDGYQDGYRGGKAPADGNQKPDVLTWEMVERVFDRGKKEDENT